MLFIKNGLTLKANSENPLKALIKFSKIIVISRVNYNADFEIYDRLFRLHENLRKRKTNFVT